jgi:hypothetical protein
VDTESLRLIRRVWRHSGVKGNVWMPSIRNIGVKDKERFREGPALKSTSPAIPELSDELDWYWTPAVSHGENRRVKKGQTSQYPAQRVLWADCDDSYDAKLLESLRPTFLWETSPGHMQAIWLMSDDIAASEYHKDGLMGMLTQALGADKSGVDVSQLLRVPGTWHHKGKPFKGRVIRDTKVVYTRGQILRRVAQGLGFSGALASELGAEDPYGDRSKLLWKFARRGAELGLPQDLTFKLIKATQWNKWRDDPDRLKEDIARAYDAQPADKPVEPINPIEDEEVTEESVGAWDMSTVGDFGPVMRKPRAWVVRDIIPEGGCGLLVAAPKVGKTRIAIEIALGVSTGRKPLGVAVRKPQPVGFFSLEDGEYLFSTRLDNSLNTDQGRHKYHWDGHITPELEWQAPAPLPLLTRFDPIDLSEGDDMQRLYETIVRYGLKLVILDTLSMSIGKSNVSDQKEMNAILKKLRIIAQTTECAIMFIHHTRKRQFEKGETVQETILGATALHAWCDFIMSLASPAEDEEHLRMGVQTKMGNHLHYINSKLKIIKKTSQE